MRFLVFVFCFMLCACGFRPLYSSDKAVLAQSEAVQIQPISGDGGYQMSLILQTKLNPEQHTVSPKYRLSVQLTQPTYVNQSIRGDNFATLESMRMQAHYRLVSIEDERTLISTKVDSNGLFNLIKDPYATTVAKDKLYDNLIKLMAEDIAAHVLAYFKGEN